MRGHVQTHVITRPWSYDVSESAVSEYTPWSKMGYNSALSGEWETLWNVGGEYVWPTGTMQIAVQSSSAKNSATGVGIRTVIVRYLNGAGVEKDETIALRGTLAVTSVATDIYRINNFRAVTCGADGQAAGSIWLTQSGSAVIYSQIGAGENRARQMIYTVPYGRALSICQVEFAAGAAIAGRSVRFQIRANYQALTGSITTFPITYTEKYLQDQAHVLPLPFPTRFPAGVDISVRAISAEGATRGNCALRGFLEDV